MLSFVVFLLVLCTRPVRLAKESSSKQHDEHNLVKRTPTSIGGKLVKSRTITAYDNPVRVESELIVPDGITLTISRGVQMHFMPNTGITVNGGTIVANGDQDFSIMMTPQTKDTKWTGIRFDMTYNKYDLRLQQSETGNEGYVEVYTGDAWRLICSSSWDIKDATVACRQMGFSEGATAYNPSLKSAQQNSFYWLTDIQCTGSETRIDQCSPTIIANQRGSVCPTAAAAQCKGRLSLPDRPVSTLQSVNVTDTTNGIEIVGTMPELSYVASQSALMHGISIQTHFMDQSSRHRSKRMSIVRCVLVNNKYSGLMLDAAYPSSDVSDFLIDVLECASNGNGEDGLYLTGRGHVEVETTWLYGNGHDGVESTIQAGSLALRDILITSNSRYGIKVYRESDSGDHSASEPLDIVVDRCNISGHWWDAAVLLNVGQNAVATLRGNQIWQNYNGGVICGTLKSSTLRMLSNNFTRNRGTTLQFTDIRDGAELTLDENRFRENYVIADAKSPANQYAVVSARLDSSADKSTAVKLTQNIAVGNRMKSVIAVTRDDSDAQSQPSLKIEHNFIQGNTVQNTLNLPGVSAATVTSNTLKNPQSDCELRLGKYVEGAAVNAQNNYWGVTDESQVAWKVCDFNKNANLMLAKYKPFATSPDMGDTEWTDDGGRMTPTTPWSKPTPRTDSTIDDTDIGGVITVPERTISARAQPYHVSTSILVGKGSKLTIEPGTTLNFGTGRGLRVEGQLVAKGNAEKGPVTLQSDGLTWAGVVVDNADGEPISELENCVISNAHDGLTLNSDKVRVRNCSVQQSENDGIVINDVVPTATTSADNIGRSLDLQGSKVDQSGRHGIKVGGKYAYNPLEIKNVQITRSGANGVEFEHPVSNISLRNVTVRDSAHYGVHVEQGLAIGYKPSIEIIDSEIADHRGLDKAGGVYISALGFRLVNISNSRFRNNSNSNSLFLDLRCNYTGKFTPVSPPTVVSNNVFESNTNQVVADIRLIYCAMANITNNRFYRNNLDNKFGALKVTTEPLADFGADAFYVDVRNNSFVENAGDYSVYFLPNRDAELRGTVTNNTFRGNDHHRASLIAGSPMYVINFNQFVSPKTRCQLEVEYSKDRDLDARNNYWGTNVKEEIAKEIVDGTTVSPRALAIYVPFLTRENSTAPPTDCNCRGNGECSAVDGKTCACYDGYTGDDCSQVLCDLVKNCSNNGKCVGPNVCACFSGWTGRACKAPSCTAVGDCSGHGQCVSLNECQCDTGYSGSNCTKTVCDGNCNGRGTCIAANLCRCNDRQWTGLACEVPTCYDAANCTGDQHGYCAAPNKCQCINNYAGTHCEECPRGQRCDGNGTTPAFGVSTMQPQTAVTPSTSGNTRSAGPATTMAPTEPKPLPIGSCLFECTNGFCDAETSTCLCDSQWYGPSCNICVTNTGLACTPVVRFVIPEEGPAGSGSPKVHVVGQFFPNKRSAAYSCTFGDKSSAGKRLSSETIECALPADSRPGSVNLMVGLKGDTPFPTELNKQLTFNFYSSDCSNQGGCDATSGYCVLGECHCHDGLAGEACASNAQAPTVDTSLVTTAAATNAVEGKPYSITVGSRDTVGKFRWSLVEGPANMTVDSDTGRVSWPSPIGSADPVDVKVEARAVDGSKTPLSWNINVPISYTATIDAWAVGSHASHNDAPLDGLTENKRAVMISGHASSLGGNTTINRAVPVAIRVYNYGQLVRQLIVWTDNSGSFTGTFTPTVGEVGKFSAIAVHPGTKLDPSASEPQPGTAGVAAWSTLGFSTKPETDQLRYSQQTNASVLSLKVDVKNIGNAPLSGFHFVEQPNRTITELEAVRHNDAPLASDLQLKPDESVVVELTFKIIAQNYTGNVFYVVGTEQGVESAFEFSVRRVYDGVRLISEPANFSLAVAVGNTENLQIRVVNIGEEAATNLFVRFTTNVSFFIVSFLPDGDSTLKPTEATRLTVGVVADKAAGSEHSESIDIIGAGGSSLLRIPCTVRTVSQKTKFDYSVNIVDEGTFRKQSSGATEPPAQFTVRLQSSVLGYSETKLTSGGQIFADFVSIEQGHYQVTVSAAHHETVEQSVFASEVEKSVSVFVPLKLVDDSLQMGKTSGGGSSKPGYVVNLDSKTVLNTSLIPALLVTPSNVDALDRLDAGETKFVNFSFTNAGMSGAESIYGVEFANSTAPGGLPYTLSPLSLVAVLRPGEIVTVIVEVAKNARFVATAACNAYLHQINYNYTLGDRPVQKTAVVLLRHRLYDSSRATVCKVSKHEIEEITSEFGENPLGAVSEVACSCSEQQSLACRSLYKPLGICGAPLSPSKQPATSIGHLAFILDVVQACVDCNRVGAGLGDALRGIRCQLDAKEECPPSAGNRRLKRLTNGFLDDVIQSLQPEKSWTLTSQNRSEQLKRVATYLEAVGYSVLGPRTEFFLLPGKCYDTFRQSMQETSESGLLISRDELEKIEMTGDCTAELLAFTDRWNSTVHHWLRGVPSPAAAGVGGLNFISFDDVQTIRQITARFAADATNISLPNVFALFDSIAMNTTSSQNSTGPPVIPPVCARAVTELLPSSGAVRVGSPVLVRISVKNLSDKPLKSLKLATQWVKSSQDVINFDAAATLKVTGSIALLTGANDLQVREAFVAEYNFTPKASVENFSEPALYNFAAVLSFDVDGTATAQRLSMNRALRIYRQSSEAIGSLHVWYFLAQPSSRGHSTENDSSIVPYSAMVYTFVNDSAVVLSNVAIDSCQVRIVSLLDFSNTLPYSLTAASVVSDSFDNGPKQLRFEQPLGSFRSERDRRLVKYTLTTSTDESRLENFTCTLISKHVGRSLLVPVTDVRYFRLLRRLTPRSDDVLIRTLFANAVPDFFVLDLKSMATKSVRSAKALSMSPLTQLNVKGKTFAATDVKFDLLASSIKGESEPFAAQFEPSFALNTSFRPIYIERKVPSKDGSASGVRTWSAIEGGKNLIFVLDPSLPRSVTDAMPTYTVYFGVPNRNSPSFDRSNYDANIDAHAPVNSSVLTVKASDGDADDTVRYSLYGGDGRFTVNERTGVVKVVGVVNDSDTFCLNVRATDNGLPPRSTLVPLTVAAGNATASSNCSVFANVDNMQAYVEGVSGTNVDSETTTPTGLPVTAGSTNPAGGDTPPTTESQAQIIDKACKLADTAQIYQLLCSLGKLNHTPARSKRSN